MNPVGLVDRGIERSTVQKSRRQKVKTVDMGDQGCGEVGGFQVSGSASLRGHIVAGGVRRVAMWLDGLGSECFGTDRAVRRAGAGTLDTPRPPLLESRNAESLDWKETAVPVRPWRAISVVKERLEELP